MILGVIADFICFSDLALPPSPIKKALTHVASLKSFMKSDFPILE